MSLKPKPGIYIPTLYFAEGLPYTVVMMMSGIFFKSLGADNVFIGLTSFLSLPWILKFAWSPLVDFFSTKRTWIILAQFICAATVAGMAIVAYVSGHWQFSALTNVAIVVLFLIAIASATQDVSIDGYYLDVLTPAQQALYVGIRNTFYRVAVIFGSGAMVYLGGKIAETQGLHVGWAVAFGCCAAALALCAIVHSFYLPKTDSDSALPSASTGEPRDFFDVIFSYFRQPGIVAIVFYILVFRLGDALMLKQAPNFLLDPPAKGGLGLTVADMGLISGTAGVIALLAGGLVASWLISKHGLKRWMWPLSLIQNSAILLYFVLAQWPQTFAVGSPMLHNKYLPFVLVINSFEQFAYGMGVAAYTVFLLQTVRSEFKAAHYAIATALMALGVMLPGAASGYIYAATGYALTPQGFIYKDAGSYGLFFLISFFASIPGLIAIYFLPHWRNHVGTDNAPLPVSSPNAEVRKST